jgi:hypothetical protein
MEPKPNAFTKCSLSSMARRTVQDRRRRTEDKESRLYEGGVGKGRKRRG